MAWDIRQPYNIPTLIWGITNDKYVPLEHSYFYGENIDTFSQSGRVRLSKLIGDAGDDFIKITENNNEGYPVAQCDGWNNEQMIATYGWSVADGGALYSETTYKYDTSTWRIVSIPAFILNIGKIGNYGFIVSSHGVYSWEYNTGQAHAGIIGSTEYVDVTNAGTYSVGTWWSKGTNFDVTHTAWNTAYLTITSTAVGTANGKIFRLKVRENWGSTGTVDVYVGGTKIGTISWWTDARTYVFWALVTTTNPTIEFRPSSSYNGQLTSLLFTDTTLARKITRSGVSDNHTPFHKEGSLLMLAVDKQIRRIETASNAFTTSATLSLPIDIRGISKNWSLFQVYGNEDNRGKKFFWDGVSQLPVHSKKYGDVKILNISWDGTVDYVVCWSQWYRKIFLSQGYSDDPIYADEIRSWSRDESSIREGSDRFGFYPDLTNNIVKYLDMVYMANGGNVWGGVSQNSMNRIFSLWFAKPSMPIALNVPISLPYGQVTCMAIKSNVLYIGIIPADSYDGNGKLWFRLIKYYFAQANDNYNDYWRFQLNPFRAEKWQHEKIPQKISFGAKIPRSDTPWSIKLWWSLNDTEIYSMTNGASTCDIVFKTPIKWFIKTWSVIRFRWFNRRPIYEYTVASVVDDFTVRIWSTATSEATTFAPSKTIELFIKEIAPSTSDYTTASRQRKHTVLAENANVSWNECSLIVEMFNPSNGESPEIYDIDISYAIKPNE